MEQCYIYYIVFFHVYRATVVQSFDKFFANIKSPVVAVEVNNN
jgi:hypothetical protein